MNYKKMQNFLRTCICIAGGFLIICLIGQLLYRYMQYGEQMRHGVQAKQETPDVYETQVQQEKQDIQAFGDLETEVNLTKSAAESAKKAEMVTERVKTTDRTETAAEAIPYIRIQLLSQDYESKYHTEISVTSDSAYQAVWFKRDEDGNLIEVQQKEYVAGEVFAVTAGEEKAADEKAMDESAADEICISIKEQMQEDEKAESDQKNSINECSGGTGSGQNSESLCVTSFTRADGYPEYAGTLHLYREEKGFILVNELPLEEYLYSVVSSEIPSGYPLEAQKAQAVCARTYARKCMERAQENGAVADLDDSVSWQVYNNYRSSEISRAAVDATKGEVLDVEEALYYSTSCLSEHREDLNSEETFAAFLEKMPEEDAEYGSPWVRWNVGIEHQTILEQMKLKYDCTAEQIDQIAVTERSGDGQVQKLLIVCGEQRIEVEGEYQIRNILSVKNSGIHLSDGSTVEQMRMLPSAYFVFENSIQTESETEILVDSEKVVYISGGGYGHGTGMSQCGAAAMAKAGADYKEILQYYYESDLTTLTQEK